MKINNLLIFMAVALVASCNEITKSKTERNDQPDIHNVESSNESMNNAILKANETLANFENALTNKNDDYENFSIKQKFETEEGGGEHIWIQDVKMIDSNYFGVVGNDPMYIKNIKFGDTIKINKSQISDWMYLDKGVVKGAFTVKVLRDEMSEEERVQFDIQSGLLFE